MNDVKIFFESFLNLFQTSFVLYGYRISFWDLFIAGWLFSIIGALLYRLLFDR